MSHSWRVPRVPVGVVVLAVIGAVSLGALAPVALGDHWHSFNNRWHGIVQGDSTTDGYFFGRTQGAYLGDTNYCYVGDTDIGINYGTYSVNVDLCSVWTGHYYYRINECRGASTNWAGPNNPLQRHNHYTHNYGGNCVVYLS